MVPIRGLFALHLLFLVRHWSFFSFFGFAVSSNLLVILFQLFNLLHTHSSKGPFLIDLSWPISCLATKMSRDPN